MTDTGWTDRFGGPSPLTDSMPGEITVRLNTETLAEKDNVRVRGEVRTQSCG